jgi:tRNA modification GTPase
LNALQQDLIAAVATPPGQGGVGILRISGAGAQTLAAQICSRPLQPRKAIYCEFIYDETVLDEGIALWFEQTRSFTGEEVVELQTHGSPVVLQQLLNAVCQLGARIARPGEFSERAFLNGKLDLTQAEAIADLISSSTIAAARAAMRSLQGDFSRRVNRLAEHTARLRILVEAAIDFPDEDIEIINTGDVRGRTTEIVEQLTSLLRDCAQGRLLSDGITVALIGPPNAGKSSLLNQLSGEEAAIVTDIPGTTRDLLKVDLVIDGLPVKLVDTAGLRHSADEVERIGVARAQTQAGLADLVLIVLDATEVAATAIDETVVDLVADIEQLQTGHKLVVMNKSDLLSQVPAAVNCRHPVAWVSALDGTGVDDLRRQIGLAVGHTHDAPFTARLRHTAALEQAAEHLTDAIRAIDAETGAEIIAEELRAGHDSLGEIVGVVTSDDLLGRIFSEFCIGK